MKVLELCTVEQFPHIRSLCLAYNSLDRLSTPSPGLSIVTLSKLDLTSCDIESLDQISFLNKLLNLSTLILRSNPLTTLSTDPQIIFPTVSTLDLTSTLLPSLSKLDPVPPAFPLLTRLQTTNTPLATSTASSRLLTIARLQNLISLNHTDIPNHERQEAELYYMKTITTLAINAKTKEEKQEIQNEHPQWSTLCNKHGTPDIVRQKQNQTSETAEPQYPPMSLGAHMVTFTFIHHPKNDDGSHADPIVQTRDLPKITDIYRLKSIVSRIFNIPLLNTKLILETDEYDPVPITRLNNTDEWSFSDSDASSSPSSPSSEDDEAT
ncbi:MAG: hypothetical protein Q9174_004391, partial [Haloplaca sp. 1 TL-2023]